MPNRVIREGILDSEKYWRCPIEARELYRHLQLLADDLGCGSLAPVLIRRRCFNAAPPQDVIDSLIQAVWDADLIRIYVVDNLRFYFITKFNQRLRRMYLRHPKPPFELYKDEPEAIEKFNKIKGNRLNLSDTCLTVDGHLSAESNLNQSIRGFGSSTVSPSKTEILLKKPSSKAESNPEAVDKNRRIAAAVASNNLDLAKQIRDE